jgi:hypothetical protein
LAEKNPVLGDPLAFYEEFVMKYDESYKNAAKAQKKLSRKAASSSARALTELTNKRKCHELEQATRNKQSKASELTTPSLKLVQANQSVLDVCVGSYVEVEEDLSPGMCSHGGTGFVIAVDGDDVFLTFTVKYNECGPSGGQTEAGIGYSRITETPSQFASTKLVGERRAPDMLLENGSLRYDGEIIRMKGDAYLIDCNFTGSDEGTSDKPKFSLLALFRDQFFSKVDNLVGPGGPYEGYLPVFQGDNAGPHTDAAFHSFVTEFCEAKTWKWEPHE